MRIAIANSSPAQKIGTVPPGGKLHLQVLTASVTVRIAADRDSLDTPYPLSGAQGFPFDSTYGIVELQWLGEVWAEGIAANGAVQPVIEFSISKAG